MCVHAWCLLGKQLHSRIQSWSPTSDRFPAVLLQGRTYSSFDQERTFLEEPTASRIHNTVLQHKFFIDGESAAHLERLDKIECGHVPPHARVHRYNGTTGMHNSLGPDCTLKNVQYWVRQDGATSKAASPAAPPS